jgi:nucleotide-binding universal stress UspA family protein
MYRKILLPVDGSENSKRAAEHAINIADVSNVDITVLFVVEPYYPKLPVLPIATLPTPDDNYYLEVREESKMMIKDIMNELKENQCKGKCNNIHLEYLIKEGKAYIELLKSIDEENVDLVVMGASGKHSTLDRLVLGSVTERVVRESKVPVIVVP